MPLFTLPIAHTARHPASHAPLKSSLQKRKRSHHDDGDDDDSLPELSPDRALSASQTNPLSLAPDEIVQYRTAGLALDEELPSVKDFPHRALPRRRRKREEEEEDTEVEKVASTKNERDYGIRLRHLGVLTTALHRSLGEGNVPRASKVWQLLLRSQVDGKPVELRQSGYWGIGAELLIREGEKRARIGRSTEDSDEEEHTHGIDTDRDIEYIDGERRWGTKEGLAKAKDYYERLILEYPYKRQFASSINGLDFWPAMLSCEVYGIQYTQRAQLQRISVLEDSQEYNDNNDSDSDSDGMEDDEDEYTFSQRVEEKRRAKKDERVWQEREDVRLQTLAATQAITARMDELMTSPPYSDSVRLLRLRAMLALYVGDLNVPGVLAGDMDEDDENADDDVAEDHGAKRIERRQRRANRDAGLKKLRKEKKKVYKLFKKIIELGGKGGEEAIVNVVEEEEEQMSD